MKKYLIIAAILVGITARGQEVKWYTIEEAVKLNKKEPRKILIDVYTSWCGWCKIMDKNTYSNAIIANYLNSKFYPVRFDAEQTAQVVFNKDTFRYVPQGARGYNEFAAALLNNQLSYPTTIFMNEQLKGDFLIPGYKDAKTFDSYLRFYGENIYKTQTYDNWITTYKSPF
jgi:thioredoxin-related protein